MCNVRHSFWQTADIYDNIWKERAWLTADIYDNIWKDPARYPCDTAKENNIRVLHMNHLFFMLWRVTYM